MSPHEIREFTNAVEYTIQLTFVVAGSARWRTSTTSSSDPGRTYAVETKWTASRGRYLDGAIAQASRQAKALTTLLREQGVVRDIVPILVVWGPGAADALGEAPRLEGDVRVVAGRSAATWRARIETAADRLEIDAPRSERSSSSSPVGPTSAGDGRALALA